MINKYKMKSTTAFRMNITEEEKLQILEAVEIVKDKISYNLMKKSLNLSNIKQRKILATIDIIFSIVLTNVLVLAPTEGTLHKATSIVLSLVPLICASKMTEAIKSLEYQLTKMEKENNLLLKDLSEVSKGKAVIKIGVSKIK